MDKRWACHPFLMLIPLSSITIALKCNNGSKRIGHPFSQPLEHSEPMNVQKAYGNQNQLRYLQPTIQIAYQVSYGSITRRSSTGCPSHALVTFGFSGKLIVMKYDTAPLSVFDVLLFYKYTS